MRVFKGSKGSFVSWCKTKEVAGGDAPSALRSDFVESIQEMSEAFIFADINGGVAQLVTNG